MNASQIENELRRLAKQVEHLAGLVGELANDTSVEFPQEFQRMVDQRICLGCATRIPDDEDPVRGNHSKCYKATMRAIDRGEFTEDEAVIAGKLALPQKAGRKPSESAVKLAATVQEVALQYSKTTAAQKKPKASKRPAQP